jgi:hypothetical protein
MVRRLRVSAAILWTALILILCWTPQTYLPVEEAPGFLDLILPIPPDKLVHGGLFMVFTVLWLRASGGAFRFLPWILIGGIAMAVISELGQKLPIVNRDGEVVDAIADLVGLVLGYPIFLVLEKYLGRLAVRSRMPAPGQPEPTI